MMESRPDAPSVEVPPPAGRPSGDLGPAHLADPRALQILSTEHWSLLASRSLAYNEAFSRAGMFLSFLSATLIVMGFLVGSGVLSEMIWPIVAILLAADLFIGVATAGRLASAGQEELRCVRGMNRIRHAYREMVPGIEPYFTTSFHDDARGVLSEYGAAPSSALGNLFHGITTAIGMIVTIDAMIVGALVGTIAVGLGAPGDVALAFGVIVFVLAFGASAALGMRTAIRSQEIQESRFPTPGE